MYVATIGVFALLYNIPRFWEVTWQTRTYENLNATITNVEPTELRNDPTYINVYITWLYLVVMYIIPFTCLAIFNLLIYKEVSLSTLWLICLFFWNCEKVSSNPSETFPRIFLIFCIHFYMMHIASRTFLYAF